MNFIKCSRCFLGGAKGRLLTWAASSLIAATFISAEEKIQSRTASMGGSHGLVAHWSFDEDFTSSVNNHLYGGMPRGEARLLIDRSHGAPRVGKGALRVSNAPGQDIAAFVEVASAFGDGREVGSFTMSGWVKLQDVDGDGMGLSHFGWETFPTSSFAFGLHTVSGTRRARTWARAADLRVYSDSGGPSVGVGTWTHVALVWNGRDGYIRSYVQGKLAREWTVPKGSRLDPMRGMNIGADKFASPASGWDGWLDDFALFDVELTPEQIGALVESTGAMASITVQNVIVKVPEPGAQQLADSQAKLPEPFVPAHETMPQGPQLGHVGERNAIVWARVPRPGRYEAIAMPDESTRPVSAWAEATAENDWCLRWEFDGLQPQTVYRVVFSDSLGGALPAKPIAFKTAPQNGRPAIVTLGFGSCASFDDGALWSSIAEHCPDGMVLLGDTPYIDRTELNWVRWAHRRFASGSELDDAFRRIPVWGTWDDHDFGKNNSDGTVLGKENNRKGFMEYRANPYFGEDGQGIYTHFRRGPIEVFLLDTRWFSNTEPSYADTHRRTLLGARQWEWLKGKLLESTAPFKVLACGMIWNEKAAGDSWGSYLHEREALFRWLGDNRIEGVVLMGGDIHVSRLLRHNTKELVGYDLTQFISSPLHDRLIPSANVPDPELIASAVEPRVFLKLTADTVRSTPILIGELVNSDGKQFFRQEISVDELRHRDGR